jgi:hypothetical protein
VGTGIIKLFLHYGCRIVILKLNYNEIPFAPDYGFPDNPNARLYNYIHLTGSGQGAWRCASSNRSKPNSTPP